MVAAYWVFSKGFPVEIISERGVQCEAITVHRNDWHCCGESTLDVGSTP